MSGPKTYSGVAIQTNAATQIGASDTTISVAGAVGYPSTGNFVIVINKGFIDEEKVLVTLSGTTFTVVVRPWDGSTAQTHAINATINHCLDADSLQDDNDHIYDTGRDDHTQYQKSSVLTTNGDTVFFNTGEWRRLGIGTTGALLNVVAGLPAWLAAGARGALQVINSSSVPSWLAIGSVGQILRSNGTDPAWTGGYLTPVVQSTTYTAKPGDLVVASAGSGAFTVSAPSSPVNGDMFGVFKFDSLFGNPITISVAAAGKTQFKLYGQQAGYVFQYDTGAAEWFLVHTFPGIWVGYTPTWGSDGTAPAIGNGTLVGYARQNGETIDFEMQLAIGSTSTLGSGFYNFGLVADPKTPSGASSQFPFGSGYLESGTGNIPVICIPPGSGLGPGGSSRFSAWLATGAGLSEANCGFVTGSQLLVSGSYMTQ